MTNKQIAKFFTEIVISWLREIAINNVECNKQMTFLDAIEDIRERASYGLNAYFEERLNENSAFQESMDLENHYDGYDGSFFL